MDREQAVKFTSGLGKIVGGTFDLVKYAHDAGIPEALGMTTKEWVTQHLGGYTQYPKEERVEFSQMLNGENRTLEESAEILGVSHTTIARDLTSVKSDEPVASEEDSEIVKLQKALDKFKKREAALREQLQIAKKPIALPDKSKRYGTVVIDPPWPMKKIEREVRPKQTEFAYPTMDYEELLAFRGTFQRLANDDCHVFMWTTHKFLPMALLLLEHYDVKYVLAMVWHKAGGYQPTGLPQYNCEFALYGRVGSPEFIDTKAFNVCFNGERQEHSRKPKEFYQLVRRVTPDGRVDIFARERHAGFDQYGNETDKF